MTLKSYGKTELKINKNLDFNEFLIEGQRIPVFKSMPDKNSYKMRLKNVLSEVKFEVNNLTKEVNDKIRFSMMDLNTNQKIVFMENAYLTDKIKNNPENEDQYYIFYRWKLKDTRKKGRFLAEFSITTDSGELIVPIRENLYVNVI